jgi:hypothetical protein
VTLRPLPLRRSHGKDAASARTKWQRNSVWSSRALSDRLDLRPNSPNNGASTAAVCATVIATRTHNCASVRSAVVTRCDRYRCCWFEPVARRLLEERRCCDSPYQRNRRRANGACSRPPIVQEAHHAWLRDFHRVRSRHQRWHR